MNQQDIAQAVRQLVGGSHRVIVCATGSNGGIDKWLTVPGASSFYDGYNFTYNRHMTTELIGQEVDGSFVSPEMAIQLAAAGYERACKYAVLDGQAGRPIIAVGVTSSLPSDYDKRSPNQAYICARTAKGFFLVHLQLPKEPRQDEALKRMSLSELQAIRDEMREEQSQIVDLVALNTILKLADAEQVAMEAAGTRCEQFYGFPGSMAVEPQRIDADPENIFDRVFGLDQDPVIDRVNWSDYVLFPGSFNPLHYGHLAMAGWMEYRTQRKVVFQISQHHPVKVELAFKEDLLRRRMRQFRYRHPVVVTRHEGLYFDKSKRFPGAHMLLGADALMHMLNPEFYPEGVVSIVKELEGCRQRGTVFWVVDRQVGDDLLTLDNIVLPTGPFDDLFQHLSAVNTISSSEIRAQQGR